MDYIRIYKTYATDVINVRSFRGVDLVIDHFFVVMKYRQRDVRFPELKGTKQIIFKVKKLLHRQTKNVYQNKLNNSKYICLI